jgi:sortase A
MSTPAVDLEDADAVRPHLAAVTGAPRAPDARDAPGDRTSVAGPAAGAPSAPGPARSRARTGWSPATATILLSASALALWIVLYALVLSPLQEAGQQRQLQAAAREQLAAQTIPIGGVIDAGSPVAVLHAPSIGLDSVVVVEGTGSAQLADGPGHRRDTALPGQPGLSVLMGRSELFGAPFGHITALHAGDTITVDTGLGTVTYEVDRVRRTGDQVPPPAGAGTSQLTLVTSEDGPDRFSRTSVFVDATLQGTPQEAQAGTPSAISSTEVAMAGDPSALTGVVVWLAALALTGVAHVWARARWGRAQALIVVVPVAIAGLWGVTQSAVLLLAGRERGAPGQQRHIRRSRAAAPLPVTCDEARARPRSHPYVPGRLRACGR